MKRSANRPSPASKRKWRNHAWPSPHAKNMRISARQCNRIKQENRPVVNRQGVISRTSFEKAVLDRGYCPPIRSQTPHYQLGKKLDLSRLILVKFEPSGRVMKKIVSSRNNKSQNNLKERPAFDAQAFLDSAGVARKVVEYRKPQKVTLKVIPPRV